MSVKTDAQLTAEIAANISDPKNKQNTAALVREVFTDIKDTMFDGKIYTFRVPITSAQVLTMNTTPITLVAAPGVGYEIELITSSCKLTYNSVDYATNTHIHIITDTAASGMFQHLLTNTLLASLTRTTIGAGPVGVNPGTTGAQLIENKALKCFVPVGNPTAGNSDIVVYGTYRIKAL